MSKMIENDQQELTSNWQDDELDRERQAELLTAFLVQQYASGAPRFTLNINSSWGYGKTFFLSHWKRDLEDLKYLVLSYNAWENDYSKDPLMSFLFEISSQLSVRLKQCASESKDAQVINNAKTSLESNEQLIKFLKKNGVQLIRSLVSVTTGLNLPAGASLPTNPYEAEQERKEAVEGFKKKLTNVISTIKQHEGADNEYFKAPLFIFIDELDRCRPNFTIELIEVVKHICNVDDVYFVFATDGEQLQASMEGTYGQGFDAEIYFNRIFSREVHLSTPNNNQFARALVREYGIFKSAQDVQTLIFASVVNNQTETERFYADFQWVADAFKLDLRAQHQLAAAFDTLRRARANQSEQTFTVGALVLILLWQRKKQLFKDLVAAASRPHSAQELAKRFEQLGRFTDQEGTIEVPTSDGWGWRNEPIPMSHLIMSFLQLLDITKRQVSEISGEGSSYMFVHKICGSPQFQDRSNPDIGLPSLTKMIDQIMLAA